LEEEPASVKGVVENSHWYVNMEYTCAGIVSEKWHMIWDLKNIPEEEKYGIIGPTC
jgi:hypothetical protein